MSTGVYLIRLEFYENGSYYRLHGNEPANSSGLFSGFWQNEGSRIFLSTLHSSLQRGRLFLFSTFEIAKKWRRFRAASNFQQTVTREMRAIAKEMFLVHLICSVKVKNILSKRWAVLSDSVNKYSYYLCGFMVPFREIITLRKPP